ncbi:motility associated factor glycosyltransferase family protein [Hydrogenothermus marinus]|uniref:Motility associated factor glycosyltransferase family protein n=1 Tax=Hydrogenothermus marinus TaxID=133270 RepID=A0A3M0BF78_9AQUI|nr:6-hydroxymethylpterin diphosphokinase MptE-like protein [Hydrogenothermus marinus]RMA93255.1 hypothetical protein CLV39_1316 [Hydrogenothermus marinus]
MDTKLFKKNLKFFKKEKPSIYKLIKDINPSFLKINKTKENIVNIESQNYKYSESISQLKNKLAKNLELITIPSFAAEKAKDLKRDWIHDSIIETWDKVLSNIFSRENLIEKIKNYKKIPLVFLNGLGTGNVINILKEDISFKYLLVFEPNIYNFFVSLYFVDWQNLYQEKEIFLIIGDNKDKIKQGLITSFNEFSPVNAITFLKISINNENKEKKEEFEKLLEESVTLALKGWGYYDDEKEALVHVYENLKHKIPYIYKPLPLQKGTNLIIVGSGPSLDETIDFIKENKDNAIVFSCGTAIHKLYKEGIVPDFQIELERPKFRVSLFSDLPEDYRKKITLLAADVVPYELVLLYKDAYLFPRTDAITQFLLNPLCHPINISPTVVNTALSLGLFLGFENFYFVGVDMGYLSLEKKHATGTIYGKKIEERKFDHYKQVEGNIQDKVYIDDILIWAKNNLETVIKSFNKERKFINISRGAKIEGTDFIYEFKNIKLQNINKDEVIKTILNTTSNEYDKFFKIKKEDFIKNLENFINDFEEKLKAILFSKNIEIALENYYEIFNNLKKLQEKDMVTYTLISGTIKHLLVKLIYILYFLENIKTQDKKLLIDSIKTIKTDIPSLKPYFEFYKNLT